MDSTAITTRVVSSPSQPKPTDWRLFLSARLHHLDLDVSGLPGLHSGGGVAGEGPNLLESGFHSVGVACEAKGAAGAMCVYV